MTNTLEGGVKETELNMNQPVQDIVKEYETKVHERTSADLCDTPREHMEPSREAEAYVAKGRLDPKSGLEIPPTSKDRSTQIKQFGTIRPEYLTGYDAIRWDN